MSASDNRCIARPGGGSREHALACPVNEGGFREGNHSLRITNLTFLAFYLNSALDTGRYADITCDEVQAEVERGTIFDFLADRLGKDMDLSILDDAKRSALCAEWLDMLRSVSARRKFGVENNGLCLLMSYCLEGIQRRQDDNPAVGKA